MSEPSNETSKPKTWTRRLGGFFRWNLNDTIGITAETGFKTIQDSNNYSRLACVPVTASFYWQPDLLELKFVDIYASVGSGIGLEYLDLLVKTDNEDRIMPRSSWDPVLKTSVGFDLDLKKRLDPSVDFSYYLYMQKLGIKNAYNLHVFTFSIGLKIKELL